jgi:hypothetical protein
MSEAKRKLTGIWHGLYTYANQPEPVYFIATVIQSGASLAGTTHESTVGLAGSPLTLLAMIDGVVEHDIITFTKAYDGGEGWDHSVFYDGLLSPDFNEIEGVWRIPPGPTQLGARGRFLMIRSPGASETAVRKAFRRA